MLDKEEQKDSRLFLPTRTIPTLKRQVVLCTIGTILEWYDFCLFSCLAPILSQLFFQRSNSFSAMMSIFAIFASGYLMRPLGAIFFGHLGDKFGRKATLLITIFSMTIATTFIGLIPTNTYFATVMLVICRLIQGFSTSGEYPGGLTLLAEQNISKRKTFIASFSIFGTGVGAFSGALVYFILFELLGNENMINWGWRIPFLLGAPLGLMGYFLRKNIYESTEFTYLQTHALLERQPILVLFKDQWKNLIGMLSISILTNVLIYINSMYCGNYLLSIKKLTSDQVIFLNLTVLSVYSFSILLFGWISDFIDKRKLLLVACTLVAVLIYPLFQIIMLGSILPQFMAQISISFLVGMILGPFSAILPEQFPAAIRYSGLSVTLNFSAAFFGSSAPIICGWIIHITHNVLSPAFYIAILAIFSMGGAFFAILTSSTYIKSGVHLKNQKISEYNQSMIV